MGMGGFPCQSEAAVAILAQETGAGGGWGWKGGADLFPTPAAHRLSSPASTLGSAVAGHRQVCGGGARGLRPNPSLSASAAPTPARPRHRQLCPAAGAEPPQPHKASFVPAASAEPGDVSLRDLQGSAEHGLWRLLAAGGEGAGRRAPPS